MQTEIILAKYGELALKGLNRNTFEDILMKNIKRRLKPLGKFTYTRAQSTIYIEPETPDIDLDVVMDNMKKIFGIAALCKACVCEKDLADISRVGIPYLEETLLGVKTFKVESKRADKQFPLKSPSLLYGILSHFQADFPLHSSERRIIIKDVLLPFCLCARRMAELTGEQDDC